MRLGFLFVSEQLETNHFRAGLRVCNIQGVAYSVCRVFQISVYKQYYTRLVVFQMCGLSGFHVFQLKVYRHLNIEKDSCTIQETSWMC